jgi:hypothetical protein
LGWHIACVRRADLRPARRRCRVTGRGFTKEGHLVTLRVSRRPAGFRTAAALAIAVTLVPLPALAAEKTPAAKAAAPSIRTSIAAHAKRDVLEAAPKRAEKKATRAAAQGATAQSGGFFRSPAGIACLAVFAAGTGYALYSASHDRIHSVARAGQK